MTNSALVISQEIQVIKDGGQLSRETQEEQLVLAGKLLSVHWQSCFLCVKACCWSWEFMLVCTIVHLHTIHENVLGVLAALFTWYITYRVWTRMKFRPVHHGPL